MNFKKYGEFRLDLVEEIQPKEFVERRIPRLDNFLRLLKEKDQEIFQKYITNLKAKLKSLTEKDFVKGKAINIAEIANNTKILKEHPELIEYTINFALQLLQLADDANLETKIKIPERNFLQAFLFLRYYQLLTLTKTIEREQAIALYKEIINKYAEERSSAEPRIKDLEALRNRYIREAEEGGIIRIISEVKDGKLIVRKDSCTWYQAMKDLPDRELIYWVTCYGDFPGTKLLNKHFVLTRNYTIVEGHPYCDEVTHDTRINDDISHPSKEFFDKIWPMNKSVNKK